MTDRISHEEARRALARIGGIPGSSVLRDYVDQQEADTVSREEHKAVKLELETLRRCTVLDAQQFHAQLTALQQEHERVVAGIKRDWANEVVELSGKLTASKADAERGWSEVHALKARVEELEAALPNDYGDERAQLPQTSPFPQVAQATAWKPGDRVCAKKARKL